MNIMDIKKVTPSSFTNFEKIHLLRVTTYERKKHNHIEINIQICLIILKMIKSCLILVITVKIVKLRVIILIL